VEELSLHVLDLAYNGVEAGARRIRIEVIEDLAADRLTIVVADDGRGMDEETIRRATDPFYTTRGARRVGLGLSLLEAAARSAGGEVSIRSAPGGGTTVQATFQHSHLDRAPLGDLRGAVLVLVVGNPEVTFSYLHRVDGKEFEFDGGEFRAALGDLSPQHPAVLCWLRDTFERDPSEAVFRGNFVGRVRECRS
jgi:anti-sigma regulatory factor (Ser/Thr protein kinase)